MKIKTYGSRLKKQNMWRLFHFFVNICYLIINVITVKINFTIFGVIC